MSGPVSRALLRDAAVVLGAFLIVGALGGWLWHTWWSPGPTAVVFEGKPYYRPDEEFAGSAMFATIALASGLLLGLVCTWRLERDEVVTLAAVVAGSVIGSAVMLAVGHALGPDSATEVAKNAADGTRIAGDLWVHAHAAWAAMPLGAVVGAVLILVVFGRRGSSQTPPQA